MFYKDIKEWPKKEIEVVREIDGMPKKIKIYKYELDDDFNIHISENSSIHEYANIGNHSLIEGNLGECTVDDDSYIGAAVTLNDGLYIGKKCNIEGQVFSDIQEKTTVKPDSCVGYNCNIGKSVLISHGAIVEDGCSIGDYTALGIESIVHQGVNIEKNCKIGTHSEIFKNIGAENNIQPYTIINAPIGIDNFIDSKCIINKTVGNYNKICSDCIIDAPVGDNNYIHAGKKIEIPVDNYEDVE